jgi:hypothetical protein
MTSGTTVPDPDPELINAQNFDFAKPKLFFKNIGKYAATSTYIHVRIPFNFTSVFNTKQAIAGVYDQLLTQHDEPFKSITKSVTDVSLSIIEGSLEEFRDITTSENRDLNTRSSKMFHRYRDLHRGYGHVHLQHGPNHTTE